MKMSKGKREAKFKKYTKKEAESDRALYISTELRERIQRGHELAEMFYNLRRMENIISFRAEQLGLDETTGEQVGEVKIYENFEGCLKPVKLLEVEYDHSVYTYKRQMMEYVRLRERFVKDFGFSEDDVFKILTGSFDWNSWQDSFEKSKVGDES